MSESENNPFLDAYSPFGLVISSDSSFDKYNVTYSFLNTSSELPAWSAVLSTQAGGISNISKSSWSTNGKFVHKLDDQSSTLWGWGDSITRYRNSYTYNFSPPWAPVQPGRWPPVYQIHWFSNPVYINHITAQSGQNSDRIVLPIPSSNDGMYSSIDQSPDVSFLTKIEKDGRVRLGTLLDYDEYQEHHLTIQEVFPVEPARVPGCGRNH